MGDALWKLSASAVNPEANAVAQLLAQRARQAAGRTDRRRAAGEELGPLAGVPFTVKETTAVEGVPTTFGTPRFRGLVAPPVARLRVAGAIPIGHSDMPTLVLAGMHTRSGLFGETVNPWARDRTPGGTSGGDAVAVATAADAPRDAGYDVREVPDVPRLDEALDAHGRIVVTEFAPTWPVVRGLLGEGGEQSA